jgi:hypothetical protein
MTDIHTQPHTFMSHTSPQASSAQPLNAQLLALCQHMAVWRDRFPAQTDDLGQLQQAFFTKLARLESDGLKLSIGIMGQVKAGKSSFLNALLFDGKPVLPVAATPKTANLTRISYGESPLLTVHFYSPQEWRDIAAQAASQGEHAEAKVARDLLKMVSLQGLDVDSLLAQPTQTLPAQDVDGLMNKLNDYVGENGRYTAVVKSTEIQLPLDELKGFDVVDTPGMNDPVPSRTQKTREYMAQCDVVFFLSRASQFLDQADMDLLARQLPGNGVKRMVLVAGQLDGAISDDGFDRKSLADTEANLSMRLGRRAAAEMEKLAAFRDEGGDSAIAAMLRTLKNPILASTFAHGFAAWEPAQWNSAMRHVHQELADLAANSWRGYQFTLQDWQRIGNFVSLRAAYQSAREDKQTLLQAQRDELLPETRRELHRRLQALADAADTRAKRLKSGDMASMDARLRACEGSITVIAQRLSAVMDAVLAKTDATLRDVQVSLGKDAARSAEVKKREGTDVVERYYEVSTSKWYKPWTWGNTERRYTTSTVSYAYIATSDVIERLVNYSRDSTALVEREFNRVVSIKSLRTDLKSALLSALDTSADGFDPSEFRSLLEGSLDRMALPDLRMVQGDVASAISRQFSGEVRDSSRMEALQQAQKEAVESIRRNLLASFEKAVAGLRQQLSAVSQNLATEFARDLENERQQLKAAFADKDQELAVYADIVAYCLCRGQPETGRNWPV